MIPITAYRITLLGLALFALTAHALAPDEDNTYSPSAPHAAYGWIPDYQKLWVRLGGDYLTSSSNFTSAGTLTSLPSTTPQLTDVTIWTQLEYGIAEDWSVKLQMGFLNRSFTNTANQAVLTGSGLTDGHFSIKWNVKAMEPCLTFEIPVTIPLASSPNPNISTTAMLGEGAFAAGLILHTGIQEGALLAAVSPGFLFRSGGYSPLFTTQGALQVDFQRGYIRGIADFVYGMQNVTVADTLPATGGSYIVGTGSPEGLSLGGKLGIKLYHEWYLEGGVSTSVWGSRYPNAFVATVNLFNAFDFYSPPMTKRAREIPFESDQNSDFYRGK